VEFLKTIKNIQSPR